MRTLIVAVCVTAVCFSAAGQAAPTQQGGGVRIGLEGVSDSRTPIAVPYFAAVPGAEAAAKEMAEVIAYDLDFSGLFLILPVGSYPKDFTGFPADYTQLNIASWQSTPADYLVYALVYPQGANIVGEFRLIDVAAGAQVMGKRLTAESGLRRLVAHQFSDEIVNHLHGKPGIATSRIVFSAGSTGKKEIYIADYDGANARQITNHGSISISPAISPDGTRVAYVSYKDRYPWMYIVDIASGKVTPLARHVGVNIAPAWAPDGQSLALTLSKDGNLEIYRVNADGSGLKRLTNNKAVDTSPTFSPDGSRIAFVSERGGAPTIYVMNADGSSPRRLSMTYGKAFDPVWSPDGTKIAFVSDHGGVRIAVMNADGSGVRTLTSQGTSEAPTWSPDSRHIMFMRTAGPQLRAVTIDTPTPRDRPIPNLSLPSQGPSWGPRRNVAGQ